MVNLNRNDPHKQKLLQILKNNNNNIYNKEVLGIKTSRTTGLGITQIGLSGRMHMAFNCSEATV